MVAMRAIRALFVLGWWLAVAAEGSSICVYEYVLGTVYHCMCIVCSE